MARAHERERERERDRGREKDRQTEKDSALKGERFSLYFLHHPVCLSLTLSLSPEVLA